MLVTLAVVHEEVEAEAICARLRANEIECSFRRKEVPGAGGDSVSGGPVGIFVHESDAAAASRLLARAHE